MKSIDQKDISPELWGVSSRLFPKYKYNREYNDALKEAVEGMNIANPGAIMRSYSEMQQMSDDAVKILAGGTVYSSSDGFDPVSISMDNMTGSDGTIRRWIAEEVARQLEGAINNAVAHLVSELNDASQTIEDLECQIETTRDEFYFAEAKKISPKQYSTSYRGEKKR